MPPAAHPFVATIDLALAPKFQSDLEEQGFALTEAPHTFFVAKKVGVACTLYQSGKLVVQGKEMAQFIEFYLEPEILKTFSYSHPAALAEAVPHIGSDEAGKGDFFGPLCVAAVYAKEGDIARLIEMGCRDSKTMNDVKIIALAKKIRQQFPHQIVRISPVKYNELYSRFRNLNRLLAWAHAVAISELSTKTGCCKALVDQFAHTSVMGDMLAQKKKDIVLEERVRAESDPVVAAASILARATFVEGIETLGQEIGMTLPKGAGHPVLTAGKILVAKNGSDILAKVSKSHFQTTQKILGF